MTLKVYCSVSSILLMNRGIIFVHVFLIHFSVHIVSAKSVIVSFSVAIASSLLGQGISKSRTTLLAVYVTVQYRNSSMNSIVQI